MNKIVMVSELGIIRSVAEQIISQVNQGRIKNKAKALIKETDKILKKCSPVTGHELSEIDKLISNFFDKINWSGKQKHAITAISFCLEMVEQSKHQYHNNIIKYLNEIFDCIEHKEKNIKSACFWSGGLAYSRWAELCSKQTLQSI